MLLCLTVAIALLLLALHNTLFWPRVLPTDAYSGATLSLLIPARNEEANLPECLAAASRQGDPVCEILVYDDHSTDGTAEIVRRAGEADPRIRLIPPRPLPPGWLGKPFACQCLAQEARGEWLLFIDADTRLAPGGAAAAARAAVERGVTFLSCWPGLVLGTYAERLLMPMLNFVVFTLFPAQLSLRSMRPSLGLAHGACILCRRSEYWRFGGHQRVQEEIFEDTILARLWRSAGLRGICLDGQDVVRVRMYSSLFAIWAGFQKNFRPAFRSEAGFWAFLGLHVGVFVLPFLHAAVALAQGRVPWTAWSAVAAAWVIRGAQAVRFRYPLWAVPFHPVAEVFLVALGLSSWYRCRMGGGVWWKGRRYRGI
ncbi:MAG: glycosyltransferase family 2 protein [Armatimonadota bacterium]|nr:glycosyltransferase family 2 protein [Armatimonadota bacterium]